MSMYEINQSTQVQEQSSVSSIPVGINDNCTLENISKETASNGSTYLCFSFSDLEGNKLKHLEWDVDPERVNKKEGESKEEATKRRVNNMLIRIKHICTKFVDPNSFSVSGSTFNELCDNLINFMGTKYQGISVRLKVIYNYRDYAALPNFCPFIETMTTNPTGLKIGSNDKMEKESAKAEVEVNSTDSDDLPF